MSLRSTELSVREEWRKLLGVDVVVELVTILEVSNKENKNQKITPTNFFREQIKPSMFISSCSSLNLNFIFENQNILF